MLPNMHDQLARSYSSMQQAQLWTRGSPVQLRSQEDKAVHSWQEQTHVLQEQPQSQRQQQQHAVVATAQVQAREQPH